MLGSKQLSIILMSLFGVAACAGILETDQPAERTYWLKPLIVQGVDTAGEVLGLSPDATEDWHHG